jgi:hypothetical protein
LEAPNPNLISELIKNLSKNLNVSLIFMKSSIRIQNLKIVGSKMATIQGSDGRIDNRKVAILNIELFWKNMKYGSAWFCKSKMGLYVENG